MISVVILNWFSKQKETLRFSLVWKSYLLNHHFGSLSILGFHFLLGIGLAGNLRRLKMSVIWAWAIGQPFR